mgnify:CR=1 FL=1
MTTGRQAFPTPDHDHSQCAASALAHAEQVCRDRGQKFTPIRRQVLQALLASHRPLGAYEIIDALARDIARLAPITVYRALDFLMAQGLVHRIESRNAFLACAHNHDASAVVAFLICDSCGSVGESAEGRPYIRMFAGLWPGMAAGRAMSGNRHCWHAPGVAGRLAPHRAPVLAGRHTDLIFNVLPSAT